MDERLKKLEELKKLRAIALKDNRKDVHTEHAKRKKRSDGDGASDQKAAKARREAEILAVREEAEAKGVDYERVRAFTYTAEAVERYAEKEQQRAEKMAGVAFADYAQAARDKYTRLTDALGGERVRAYADAALVAAIADAAAPVAAADANARAYAALDSAPAPDAVARLVKDVHKQNEARKAFSKRRAHNPDDDVTYINERNMRFNKKIARAYDKHTAEIKAAFERGTAL